MREDGLRNGYGKGYFHYLLHLWAGSESAKVYRYLKALRHCEYYSNRKTIISRFLFAFYRLKITNLGSRYHIQIPLNKTGYGLRVIHLSGGGGRFFEYKAVWQLLLF